MSTSLFSRPPREPGPAMPQGEVSVQEPPALPGPAQGNMSSIMTFMPMAVMMGVGGLTAARPGSGPLPYVGSGLIVLAMAAMMLGNMMRGGGQSKGALDSERRDYLRYLSQLRRQLHRVAAQQRSSLVWRHPDPAKLWAFAGGPRLWERRVGDVDYGEIRIGIGPQRIATPLASPKTKPIDDLEPLCARALRRFITAFSTVPDLPVALLATRFGRILLRGEGEDTRNLARVMVAQLATMHPPDELLIAVCAPPEVAERWDWVKWLPHNQHPTDEDEAGSIRLRTSSYPEMEQLLGATNLRDRSRFSPMYAPNVDQPLIVILVDGVDIPNNARVSGSGFEGVLVVDVGGSLPWVSDGMTMRLKVKSGKIAMVNADDLDKDVESEVGTVDQLSIEQATALARVVAPKRLGGAKEKSEPLSGEIELGPLVGIPDTSDLDLEDLWSGRSVWDTLRVPVGVTADGEPAELDIKESALGGSGPHGMLIGATGSGKSELLRTLVLAMSLKHSPERFNMILVDFKGGATFMGLEDLPHVSATITNLADDLLMVDRMQDSINGELVRRQEVLRKAGVSSNGEYEKARAGGAPLEPMPTLFIIVDEFSELLSAKREFMDLFIMIGRLGRSLGVHLLLASQRLDEGRIHVLESHLSYRIGLRTFSVMESRAVLGVPDAAALPPSPGLGFIKADNTSLTRFKGAYVSGPFQERRRLSDDPLARFEEIVSFEAGLVSPPIPSPTQSPEVEAPEPEEESTRSVLEVIVDQMRGQGAPARQVWLPPLDEAIPLGAMIGELVDDPLLGTICADEARRGLLTAPIGIIDKPFEQRRDALLASLRGGTGHVAIVGGPQSGKSTMLRTLILGLALTHTPREVQFYILDFGGGTMNTLAALPHVGGVAGRRASEAVARTLAEMTSLVAERERIFTEYNIDSMETYRRRRAAGEFAEDPFGDVFLVIDGLMSLREEFPDLEQAVISLAGRSLTFGVHLVAAANRWSDIRLQLREAIGSRFELHLGESMDSIVAPRAAATVPARPGRGLTHDQFHFLTALPRESDDPEVDLTAAVAALVQRSKDNWPGPKAPPVRLLPAHFTVHDLPPTRPELVIPLGLDEAELAPVWHDFDKTPNLMIFGDNESGKTNTLRLILQSITARYSAGEARVMLGDAHRDLRQWVPADMQLGYAVTPDGLKTNIDDSMVSLRRRVPGPEIETERLPKRDWWTGPRLFIVVDDFELFEGNMGSPGSLDSLVEVLPHGQDISVHVVFARSSSGASRAFNRPLTRRLWDLGTPVVLLSTPKDEGRFLGDVRPQTLPPGRAQYVTRRGHRLMQIAVADVSTPTTDPAEHNVDM